MSDSGNGTFAGHDEDGGLEGFPFEAHKPGNPPHGQCVYCGGVIPVWPYGWTIDLAKFTGQLRKSGWILIPFNEDVSAFVYPKEGFTDFNFNPGEHGSDHARMRALAFQGTHGGTYREVKNGALPIVRLEAAHARRR